MRGAYVLVSLTLAAGCKGNTDLGESCPMDIGAIDPSQGSDSVDFPTVVQINTQFPCDSLVCVSTSGREGYCSQECRNDDGCPSAFECKVVMQQGEFADKKYCVWRACRVQLECGSPSDYDCIEGNYGPNAPPGLCDFVAEK